MFFAADPIDWAAARQELAGQIKWPRSLAIIDLRFLQDQAMLPRGTFPTRRTLAATWGWSQSRVSRLLSNVDAWSDPKKREAWDRWFDQNRRGPKVDQKRTRVEPKVDQKRTKRSPSKPGLQERPNQKRTKSEPDSSQTRAKDDHTRVRYTATDTSTDTATDTVTDLEKVWTHYREGWARVHGTPLNRKPPKRTGLATVIREHGVDRATDLIDWWEQSSDERSKFLRERRIGHATLFRPSKASAYLDEWVEPWLKQKSDPFQRSTSTVDEPAFARRFRLVRNLEAGVIEGE